MYIFFGHDWNWWYLSGWAVYSVISPSISKWSIWADLWTVCEHKRHCIDRVKSLLSWLLTTFLIPLNVPTAIAIGQCYSRKINDSLSELLNCIFAHLHYSTFYSIVVYVASNQQFSLISNWTNDFLLLCWHKLLVDWKTLQVLQWGPLCVWVCRCIFDQFWMQESEHVL